MIYELRTYTLKPMTTGKFEEEFEKSLAVREKYSRLAGLWHTEIGPLNQVVHLWPYEDLNARAAARSAVNRDPSGLWPPKVAELEVDMQNDILTPAPFMRPLTGEPQALGNVYELRVYTYQTGSLSKVVELWAEALPYREKFSPLAGAWTSEIGGLNRFYHLWPYKDLNERARIRQASFKDPHWPAPTREWLVRMENKIMVPARFSPLH